MASSRLVGREGRPQAPQQSSGDIEVEVDKVAAPLAVLRDNAVVPPRASRGLLAVVEQEVRKEVRDLVLVAEREKARLGEAKLTIVPTGEGSDVEEEVLVRVLVPRARRLVAGEDVTIPLYGRRSPSRQGRSRHPRCSRMPSMTPTHRQAHRRHSP